VQAAFNAAALVLSSTLAYKFAHLVLAGSGSESPLVCVILAGSIYFPLNSTLVAIVIGLVEGQPLKLVGAHCYPTMVLTYVYFLNRAHRPLPAMMLPSASEEECPAEVRT